MEYRLLDVEKVRELLSRPSAGEELLDDDIPCCSIADVLCVAEDTRKAQDRSSGDSIIRHCEGGPDHRFFEEHYVVSLDSQAVGEGLLDAHSEGPPVLRQRMISREVSPLHSVRLVSLFAAPSSNDMDIVEQADAAYRSAHEETSAQ